MQQRITISIDDSQAEAFDALIARRGYRNRSEAFRDLIRGFEAQDALENPDPNAQCVAVASYVYNHHVRQLSTRLTDLQHEHAGLVISQMHAHIANEDCMEAVFLSGTLAEVRAFADALVAEPGIRHGRVNIIPVVPEDAAPEHSGSEAEAEMRDGHDHGHDHGHGHSHSHPHPHPHAHPAGEKA